MKAVCFTFDWVPKLIQISFQAMEQKIVQRCETMVDADACKASYTNIHIKLDQGVSICFPLVMEGDIYHANAP